MGAARGPFGAPGGHLGFLGAPLRAHWVHLGSHGGRLGAPRRPFFIIFMLFYVFFVIFHVFYVIFMKIRFGFVDLSGLSYFELIFY